MKDEVLSACVEAVEALSEYGEMSTEDRVLASRAFMAGARWGVENGTKEAVRLSLAAIREATDLS